MGTTIWLSEEQAAHLRRELERSRDELREALTGKGDERARLRMISVQAALLRLENGTYGECVQCEEPVGYELLHERPEATLCAACEAERRRPSAR